MTPKKGDYPYLWERDGRYYFRMHIPKALQHFFGADQLRIGLKTRLHGSAVKFSKTYEAEVVSLFEKLDRHLRTGNVFSGQREIDEAVSHYRPSRSKKADPVSVFQLFQKYFTDQKDRWSLKSGSETLGTLRMIADMLGANRNCRDVYVRDAETIKDELRKSRVPDTVNKLLRRVDDAYLWGVKHQYTDNNPFKEMVVPQSKEQRDSDEKPRWPLTDEQIRQVYEHIVMQADRVEHPSLYWVPLIAMYSGLRQTEICQLYKQDIVTVDDVPCISVDNKRPYQTIKNKQSRRLVPIHVNILAQFQEYIDSVDHERIFPDLAPFKYGFGHSFKLFMPRFRKLISTDDHYDFHSIRHSVATRLADANWNGIKRADLMGHKRESGTTTDLIYADKSKVVALQELVDSIQYPGINP